MERVSLRSSCRDARVNIYSRFFGRYKKHGTVHGIPQPPGMQRCQEFPGGPIYTVWQLNSFQYQADANASSKPSTKAPVGQKDENITPEQASKIVGEKYAARIEAIALKVYKAAYTFAVSILHVQSSCEYVGSQADTDAARKRHHHCRHKDGIW